MPIISERTWLTERITNCNSKQLSVGENVCSVQNLGALSGIKFQALLKEFKGLRTIHFFIYYFSVTNAPVTEAPVSQAPVTQAPLTEAPSPGNFEK